MNKNQIQELKVQYRNQTVDFPQGYRFLVLEIRDDGTVFGQIQEPLTKRTWLLDYGIEVFLNLLKQGQVSVP